MTLRKSEASSRELELLRARATNVGQQFAVRYSLGDKPYDPPQFCESLAEARSFAAATFTRLNTGDGVDVHARPEDMMKVEVWLERFISGKWRRDTAPARYGFYNTNPLSKR
jgi:hypothetical protein